MEKTNNITLMSKITNAKYGICGLKNLGNSCYLNTSIQCLSNCWEITNYFLRDEYKKDINESNPLGSKGKLCEAYSEVIKKLWFEKEEYYTPKQFKKILSEVNPMYSGNIPQDSQEFLTYLIDILHEDLNKVKTKPYIVSDSESKKDDNIKSLEEFYNFKRRNQSIFVELFYGQFKSFIVCPNKDCQMENTKFEPFLNLSLPIETKSLFFKITCFFIFYDISIKPIKLILEFRDDCTIMVLRKKIGQIFKIHPFSFLIVKIYSNYIIDSILHSKLLIYTNSLKKENVNDAFFLIQFNPKDFYNPDKNRYITKENIQNYRINNYNLLYDEIHSNQNKFIDLIKEEYYDNDVGIPFGSKESYYKIKGINMGSIFTDLNNGFNEDYILTFARIAEFCKDDPKEIMKIIFPRVFMINKKSTCKEVYNKIYEFFEYFYEYKDFDSIFKNYSSDKKNNNYQYLSNNNYPFLLRIINFSENDVCIICKDNKYHNCLLPFTDKITIQDLINEYPKNKYGEEIDNTYYYLTKDQRQKYNIAIKDFALEIVFPNQMVGMVNNLNQYQKLQFKIYKNIDNSGVKQIPLSRCFENFMKWEELGNQDKYCCPNCNTQQNAKKKIQIDRCPHILIIHLKRFDENKKKIEIKIDYPIEGLNMEKYVFNNSDDNYPMKYDLFAITCHIGNKGFGHYYSICKNVFKKKWYKIDDNKITEINNINDIITKDAYVLFYRRRHLENIIDLEYLYHLPFISYEDKIIELNKLVDNSVKEK